MMHYRWPDLGESIKHKTIQGIVISRSMGEQKFTVLDDFGGYFEIKLEDFILEEIRQKS